MIGEAILFFAVTGAILYGIKKYRDRKTDRPKPPTGSTPIPPRGKGKGPRPGGKK